GARQPVAQAVVVAADRDSPNDIHRAPEAGLHLRDGPVPLARVAGQLHIAETGTVSADTDSTLPVRHRAGAPRGPDLWEPQLLIRQLGLHSQSLAVREREQPPR